MSESMDKPTVKPVVRALMPDMASLVDKGKCPFCEKEITEGEFRDALGKKEYMISGLCQACQDDMFGV